MFEIFKAMTDNPVKAGRKKYHLYDCSGAEVIERERRFLEGSGYTTVITENGNGWYSLYCNPKHK